MAKKNKTNKQIKGMDVVWPSGQGTGFIISEVLGSSSPSS